MSKFCGGPFNEGCHEAVLAHLRSLYGDPPPTLKEAYEITDADYLRMMPRHYELSIPSDIIEGFPLPRRKRRAT